MSAFAFPRGLPQPKDGNWAYVLDDFEITYGPGPWPFYKVAVPHNAPHSEPRDAVPSSARLAPDIAYYAWRSEYVEVEPLPDGRALARFRLISVGTTRPHHDAVYIAILDYRHYAAALGPHIPSDLQDLAVEKTVRIQAFLLAAVAERDTGAARPTTAQDLHTAQRPKAPNPTPHHGRPTKDSRPGQE